MGVNDLPSDKNVSYSPTLPVILALSQETGHFLSAML